MEQILRKLVELTVLALAYIPMGAASIAFIISGVIFLKRLVVWGKTGAWLLPELHETVNLGFLHYLMDERLSGVRRYLIQGAAKAASLPSPLVFLFFGIVCLAAGLLMLNFARAIKSAAQ